MRGIGAGKWAKYIHLKGTIAGKIDKSHWKTKGHRGNEPTQEQRGRTAVRPRQHDHASTTMGCDEHHGLPVVAPAQSRTPAPRTLRFGACLVRVLFLYWVIWASFAIVFDPLNPQKHLLILLFRLVNLNSAKPLKTSKTIHNRRNMGIIRIIMHFNPLKWLLNT